MTDQEWKKAEIQLKSLITTLRNRLKINFSLNDKLRIKRACFEAENALREHRLN